MTIYIPPHTLKRLYEKFHPTAFQNHKDRLNEEFSQFGKKSKRILFWKTKPETISQFISRALTTNSRIGYPIFRGVWLYSSYADWALKVGRICRGGAGGYFDEDDLENFEIYWKCDITKELDSSLKTIIRDS